MKFKITGDASFEYVQRWKVILQSVAGLGYSR